MSQPNRAKTGEGYQQRIVAFLDILGFSDLVTRSASDPDVFDTIGEALDNVESARASSHAWGMRFNGVEVTQTLKTHAFSDSIIISDEEVGGIFSLLKIVSQTCFVLFRTGVETRGAITTGKLYHTKRAVFGPALIEAYQLEVGVAKYPRILVTDRARLPPTLEHAEIGPGGKFRVASLFKVDADGLHYFDWLSFLLRFPGLFTLNDEDSAKRQVKSDLERGRNALLAGIVREERYDVRAKHGWLINYFNAAVAESDYVSDLRISVPNVVVGMND
jgi:hypothetical protein